MTDSPAGIARRATPPSASPPPATKPAPNPAATAARPKAGNFSTVAKSDISQYQNVSWKEKTEVLDEMSQINKRQAEITAAIANAKPKESTALKSEQASLAARQRILRTIDQNFLDQKNEIAATFEKHVLNELQFRHDRELNSDITQIANSMIGELGGGEIVESVVGKAVYDFKMKGLKPGDERAQALVREASYYSKERGEKDQMSKLNELYGYADPETKKAMIKLDGFRDILELEAFCYFTMEDTGDQLEPASKRILEELEGKKHPSSQLGDRNVQRFSRYPKEIQSLIKGHVADIATTRLP